MVDLWLCHNGHKILHFLRLIFHNEHKTYFSSILCEGANGLRY